MMVIARRIKSIGYDIHAKFLSWNNKKENLPRQLLILSCLFTLIFIVLYNKYITGENIYAFYDVGSDSFLNYYPHYALLQNFFHGGWSYVVESIGGGVSIASVLSLLIDPFTYLLFIIPMDNWGFIIILQAFLKMFIICVCSFLYFNNQLKTSFSKTASALIWTFCGYMVLWGQEYSFLTAAMYFTLFVYFLDNYIDNRTKYYKCLVLIMGVFCASNVYSFYSSGLFAIFYMAYKMKVKRETHLSILKREIKLGVLIIYSIMLSAIFTLPWIETFFESNRSGVAGASFLTGFDPKRLFFAIQRFFSNNTLGDAINYKSYLNYYEIGAYCTSILLVCALTYFFFNKDTRKKSIISLIIIALLITSTFPAYLLNLNPYSFRWSYLLSFVAVIVIGCFLDKIDSPSITPGQLLFGDIICFGVMILSCVIVKQYSINISYMTLLICYLFLVVYSLLIILSIRRRLNTKIVKAGLLFIICLELVVMNYPTVNNRVYLTNDQIANQFYNDGTKEVVQKIKEQDDTYFRADKSYLSVFLDDALVQGYSSVNSYSSLNTETFTNYLSTLGLYPSRNVPQTGNYLFVPSEDFVSNTLLGIKYVISNNSFAPFGYRKLLSSGDRIVYQNEYLSSIGYTYFNQISKEDFNKLNTTKRKIALISGFYYTNEGSQASKATFNFSEIADNYDLPDDNLFIDTGPEYTQNCTVALSNDKATIVPTTNNSVVSFKLKKPIAASNGIIFTFKLKTDKNNTMKIYWDESDGQANYSLIKCANVNIYAGENEYMVGIPAQKITNIRIDPVLDTTSVEISNMQLNSKLADQYISNAKKLQQVSLQNPQFLKSTLTGTINNTTNNEGMMCVPFGYSKAWTLIINGESQQVYNINGGLVGFVVPKGMSKIELSYKPVTLNIGMFISLISLVILLFPYMYWKKIKDRISKLFFRMVQNKQRQL